MGSQKPRRLTSTFLGLIIVFSVLSVMNYVSINVSATEYNVYSDLIINRTIWNESDTIILHDCDLIIQQNGILTYNDSVTLELVSDYPGEHGITIQQGGQFIINSPSGNTVIKSSDITDEEYTYWFTNSGTLDFLGATVERVYGNPSDKTNTGGIRNEPGSVCNLTNCNIEDSDTHSLFVEGNSTAPVELNLDNINIINSTSGVLDGTGIMIKGNVTVNIDDSTIKNTTEDGVNCLNASDIVITNCYILNNGGYGIFVNQSSLSIEGNTIENNECTGIRCENTNESIMIANNTITDNVFNGIHLYSVNNTLIDNNTMVIPAISSDYWIDGAICMIFSNNNTIRNNNINSTGITTKEWSVLGGIGFYNSNDNVIENNVINLCNDAITDDSGYDDPIYGGISVITGNNNNSFYNNTITNAGCSAILLHYCTNCTFYNNSCSVNLTNCAGGIRLSPDVNNNSLYHNNFFSIKPDCITDNGVNNSWDDGYPSGGNYWGDYTGTDQYCGENQTLIGPDFIGDTHYNSTYGQGIGGSANSEDHYPLMIPWPCDTRSPRDVIRINDYTEFTSSRGVTSGNGTVSNPYVIENYVINATGDGCGIYVGNTSKYFEIRNCYIHNSSGYETSGYYEAAGINLNNVQNGTVDKSVLIDNGYGLVFNTACKNTVNNCDISSNGEGIRVDWYSCNNSVNNNTISDNSWGCYILEGSNYNDITQNNISSNDDYGIKISEESCNNNITYNDIASNGDYGVSIAYANCENNSIHHNNFYNNNNGSTQGYDIGVNNSWDNGYPSGGNYWSDYNGTDVYGGANQTLSGKDGIGDTNYSINGTSSSIDQYPMMAPNMVQYTYWAKTYGGSSQEYARAIQQTSDGGSIVAGYTYSNGTGDADYWVLKLTSNGTIDWQKTYGSSATDMAYSIDQTTDGGYIVAGKSNINGASNSDFLVLKLDENGTIEWNKTYGNSSTEIAYSIQETSDNGFIVAGQSNDAVGAGNYDGWVVKLNETGNVSWQKTYGGSSIDIIYSIQETSDSGFIFAGQTLSSGAGIYDYWVVKINNIGVLEWNKTYGGSSIDAAYTVQETTDGGFIVAGQSYSFGNNSEYWVLKLDENGTVEWQKTYGNTTIDSAYPIQQTSDGGYIIGGTSNTAAGAGNYDSWIVKVNDTGEIEWQNTYGGSGYDRLYDLTETSNGEYLVAGYTGSFGAGSYDFWVMNIGPEGGITFDYNSSAYVNVTQVVPNTTNCSVGNATSTTTESFLATNTPTVSTVEWNCTVKTQATPSYGWY